MVMLETIKSNHLIQTVFIDSNWIILQFHVSFYTIFQCKYPSILNKLTKYYFDKKILKKTNLN